MIHLPIHEWLIFMLNLVRGFSPTHLKHMIVKLANIKHQHPPPRLAVLRTCHVPWAAHVRTPSANVRRCACRAEGVNDTRDNP